VAVVNFQVSILKVLASYPNRLATLADIKRDLAILATSGDDWASYSKRLGATLPSLDVFSLGFVQRYSFGWRLTAKGAAALELMEQKVKTPVADVEAEAATSETLLEKCPPPIASAPDQPSSSPVDRRALFTVIDGGRSQVAA
jgi:hypothetical protein